LKEKLERERSELADKVKKDKEEHFERIQERKRQSQREITQKMVQAFLFFCADPMQLYQNRMTDTILFEGIDEC
jgi:predicted ATP-dependent protease